MRAPLRQSYSAGAHSGTARTRLTSVSGSLAESSACDPETVVATLSGLSATLIADNDAIRLDVFGFGELDYTERTCIQECQANNECFAFDETADGECAASTSCRQHSWNHHFFALLCICASPYLLPGSEASHVTASASASSPEGTISSKAAECSMLLCYNRTWATPPAAGCPPHHRPRVLCTSRLRVTITASDMLCGYSGCIKPHLPRGNPCRGAPRLAAGITLSPQSRIVNANCGLALCVHRTCTAAVIGCVKPAQPSRHSLFLPTSHIHTCNNGPWRTPVPTSHPHACCNAPGDHAAALCLARTSSPPPATCSRSLMRRSS